MHFFLVEDEEEKSATNGKESAESNWKKETSTSGSNAKAKPSFIKSKWETVAPDVVKNQGTLNFFVELFV